MPASIVSIPGVDPLAGLSYHSSLYARMAGVGTIYGWNISFAAENTSMVPSIISQLDGETSVSSTHLFTGSIPPTGEAEEIYVFYQTHGDDITMYTGSMLSGEWSKTTLPIPD